MWMFSKIGFFSAVAAMKNNKTDPSRVVVRARSVDHLKALKKEFPAIGKMKIETEGRHPSGFPRDYPARIVMPKDVWSDIVGVLAEEIDYTNFKNSIDEDKYHDAMMRVWSVMRDYQDGVNGIERKF